MEEFQTTHYHLLALTFSTWPLSKNCAPSPPILVMNWTNEELAFLSPQPSSLHSLFAHFSLFECTAANSMNMENSTTLQKFFKEPTISCREQEILLPLEDCFLSFSETASFSSAMDGIQKSSSTEVLLTQFFQCKRKSVSYLSPVTQVGVR